MEWHVSDAQNLQLIDQTIGTHHVSPSQYEVVRRVIYATGDLDYGSIIHFSESALPSGAAALAARTTIIVDVPMVQVGINPAIQGSFANPVYCSLDALTRPQKGKSQAAWGVETLAQRYPEAIFVVGSSGVALATLVDLIELGKIHPALVIGVPAGFLEPAVLKSRLQDTMIPHVRIDGTKGGVVVATAIMDALVDLAWQAYGQQAQAIS
ncbi:MAG: precorrin-8X methylmutase [Cyanobacteria bacterium REEB459]|nr:precorrin-8X methylmutase [Cyanobacteria bacterium REEB459]